MLCREGHESTDPDYCSVCGIAIASTPTPGAPPASGSAEPASPAAPAGVCPVCGEARPDPSARFCEVCRFDFVAETPGPPPAGRPTAAPATATGSSAAAVPAAPPTSDVAPRLWEAVVTVDPALDDKPDPNEVCPVDEPERVFPLDRAETLIGRRDVLHDIRPEIPVHDPVASRRHAKLLRRPDGSVAVLDLASMNGTRVNGAELAAGTPRPLQPGDEITIGRWTRIVVRGR